MGKFFAWLWGSFSLFMGRCVLIFCILPVLVMLPILTWMVFHAYGDYTDRSHRMRQQAEATAPADTSAASAQQQDKCLPGMTTEQCNATRTDEQKGIPADQAASS